MDHEDLLPVKCRSCIRRKAGSIYFGCTFCEDAQFQESILCDLNRSVQDHSEFQCGAYRPRLRLVGEPEKISAVSLAGSEISPGKARYQDMIRTQREKFSLALDRQSLERRPDEVFADLKYHLAWNVIYRRSAFIDSAECGTFFQEVFREYGESSGSSVYLLWLCTDHIHVYAECDVDHSVEDLIQGIKQVSGDALLARFPNMKDRVFPEGEVWDPAYFVETVG